jgi:hypothetical protein
MGKYYRQYLLCLLYLLKHTQPELSNKAWILSAALLPVFSIFAASLLLCGNFCSCPVYFSGKLKFVLLNSPYLIKK